MSLVRTSFAALVALGLAACASTSVRRDLDEVSRILEARGASGALSEFDEDEAALVEPAPVELDGEALTEARAVAIALRSNRALRAAMHELESTRGAAAQASLPPNPGLDLELRVPAEGDDPLQGDVGLELELRTLFLLPLRAHAAEADVVTERIRLAGLAIETAYLTRVAFYEVVARRDMLTLETRALDAAVARYEAAAALYAAGNTRALDVETERANAEAARVAVAERELELFEAHEALVAQLGLSGRDAEFDVVAPRDDLATPPEVAELERTAIQASLDLAEHRAHLEALSRRVAVARAEGAVPPLSGGLHAEHDGERWEVGGHLGIGLPVFDRQQGRIGSLLADYHAARERFVGVAITVRSVARRVAARVTSSARRVKHYRDALLPSRERALEATLRQYNAMQLGVFDVLDAQREVTRAALDAVRTSLEARRARAALALLRAGRHGPLTDAVTGDVRPEPTLMPPPSGSATH